MGVKYQFIRVWLVLVSVGPVLYATSAQLQSLFQQLSKTFADGLSRGISQLQLPIN
jgi:hypothetical protein